MNSLFYRSRRPGGAAQGAAGELTERFAWRGVAEAAVLIVVLLLADSVVGRGDRFLGVEPHPFGIAVLLVAAQYGTAEAAAAAILASIGLLAFNLPRQSFDQDHSVWLGGIVRDPLIWLAMSLVVGAISGRTRGRARESAALATRRESELAAMLSANTDLVSRVGVLETRIAGQQRTVTSIYEAARGLGPDREGVLSGALALVRAATGATGTSIYLIKGDALHPAGSTSGSGSAERRPIPADSALFAALVGERRCLLINREADQELLGAIGLVAGPLVTEAGTVLGALVVETIPFAQLHLGAVAGFRSVCEWVAAGLERAEHYDSAQQGRFLVEGSSLVSASQASRLIGIMGATARRIGFNLSLMDLELKRGDALGETRRTLVTVLEAVLRDTDILIEGDDRHRLRVLMPGTPLRNVPLVAERLSSTLQKQDPMVRDQLSVSWLALNEQLDKELVA